MCSCSCCTTETTSCIQQWWTWKRLHSMWRLPHLCILQLSVYWNTNSERKRIKCFLFLVECWVWIILRERLMWWSIKDDGFEFTCHVFIVKTWFMKVEREHRGTGSLDHDLRWFWGGGWLLLWIRWSCVAILEPPSKSASASRDVQDRLPHVDTRTTGTATLWFPLKTLGRLRVEEEMWMKWFAFTG